MTIDDGQIKEALEWLIESAFVLEPIEQDSNEFKEFTTKDEGIYGYHTCPILLDGINTDMLDNYGSVSILIEDEADAPRLVTISDHKGSVAMGLYRLKPKSEIACVLMHFIFGLENNERLITCLQRCATEGFVPNPPHDVMFPATPMPWDGE